LTDKGRTQNNYSVHVGLWAYCTWWAKKRTIFEAHNSFI